MWWRGGEGTVKAGMLGNRRVWDRACEYEWVRGMRGGRGNSREIYAGSGFASVRKQGFCLVA